MKQQLMLVAMLSVGTALTTIGRIKPVAASLTPPASYDYSYTWNATASEQYLNVNGVDSIPLYTRVLDVYWNYSSTFNVVDGLDVTHFFGRSTTAWQASGIFWKPDENRIGSSNVVGGYSNKFNISIVNDTSHDYYFYFDVSSSPAGSNFMAYKVNGLDVAFGDGNLIYSGPNLTKLILPAYGSIEARSRDGSANAYYFDAWYLQDLGISDSYQAGLDAETDGILTDYLGTDAQQIGWVLIGIAAILFAFKGGK
jgi:hypothetical protein